MLESSLSYDDDAEQDFKSLTASCKAPGNDYTAATGYLSTPSPAKAALTVPASWCASKYTVKAGDTCDSISLTNSVSTFGIVHANGLFLSCENLPSTGNQICLPPKCAIKRIHYGHTCLGLAEMYGVTEAQLVDWNPNFDSACLTIGRWYHTHICVSYVVLYVLYCLLGVTRFLTRLLDLLAVLLIRNRLLRQHQLLHRFLIIHTHPRCPLKVQ